MSLFSIYNFKKAIEKIKERRISLMKRSNKLYISVIIIVIAFSLTAISQVFAEDKQPAPVKENKVVKFFKDVINWPFSITKKGAETVARTVEKGTTTVVTTGSSAVESVTGKPEKLKEVIVEPVKGSAETAYTAVEGTVKTPVEGTKEAFKPEEAKKPE
jgi:hypothetical protein